MIRITREPKLTEEELRRRVEAVAMEFVRGYIDPVMAELGKMRDELSKIADRQTYSALSKQQQTHTSMIENLNEGLEKVKEDIDTSDLREVVGQLEHRVDDLESEVW